MSRVRNKVQQNFTNTQFYFILWLAYLLAIFFINTPNSKIFILFKNENPERKVFPLDHFMTCNGKNYLSFRGLIESELN